MKKILTSALLAVATLPVVASAQNASSFDALLTLVTSWINRLIPFLLLLATLFFFWGLTKFILKAGNEEAQGEAKQTMIWGVIAIFVMVSFWGLVSFLSTTLGLGNTVNVVAAPAIGGLLPPQTAF